MTQSLSPPGKKLVVVMEIDCVLVDEQSSTVTTPPRHKRYLPAKNVISLHTEMRHPRGKKICLLVIHSSVHLFDSIHSFINNLLMIHSLTPSFFSSPGNSDNIPEVMVHHVIVILYMYLLVFNRPIKTLSLMMKTLKLFCHFLCNKNSLMSVLIF